jgi:DNA topoisomerase-1
MPTTSLVIVESPAKCKKIEMYLGAGYKVIASYGHLRTIANLEDIDINNHFLTTFTIIQDDLKLKQIEKIRTEIQKADDVIIATDDDREGEAIGWHICDLFGLSVTNTKRIIFHEITEQAIRSAIFHPKRLNMNLVHAQQARQILDLLVGFTISPILWNCVSNSSLSAGRCQTPALRLVYENYLDIKQSPGKLVYNTTGYFSNLNLAFDLNKQFENETDVQIFLELCKSESSFEFICNVSVPKKTIKKSPEPLTTSALQQMASNELHMSPKDTMKYAQQLYEAGYITYMRTDSKKYSEEFVENTKIYIATNYTEQHISNNIHNLIVTENKSHINTVAEEKGIPAPQEAHEAIRPVDVNIRVPSLEDSLQGKAIRLYELIWRRSLESCMSSAQYNSVTAKIPCPLNTEFLYKAEQPLFLGWQAVSYKPDKHSEEHYQYLNALRKNIVMKPKKIDSKFTLIELKSHYTEARLVQLLEEKGIGRPSTFASLVDKIQERKYVVKQNIEGKEIEYQDYMLVDNNINSVVTTKEFGNEKNKLVIQPLGIIVIEFLLDKFNMFFNYDYTKNMEDSLDQIANGLIKMQSLCSECHSELNRVTDTMHDFKKFCIKIDDCHSLIIGKHGPVVKYCDPKSKKISFIATKKDLDLNELKQQHVVTLEDVIDSNVTEKNAIGKYKGKDLFIKKGKYGIYAQWGKEFKSLKEGFDNVPLDKIKYMDVIKFLDKDTLDPQKPVGLVRELNDHLSIRTGKYGDYIFYKKPRMKTPQFFKLNEFKDDYKKCDRMLLLNWIKQTHKID